MTAPLLRDYQERAVQASRTAIARGAQRVLLVAPTGSGKTVIASAIIHSLVGKQKRALFLAHRRELIDQCSAKLDTWGVDHGIICANDPRARPWAPTQVASVQTLVRRDKPPADLVIVDEAHHARAKTYETILAAYPGVPVLGLTATPWRLDGRGLGELFAEEVVVATPRELIAAGHLVGYTGYAYQAPDTSGLRARGGDFRDEELEGLVLGERGRQLAGDLVEQYLAHARGRRALVFAVSVLHSQALMARFLEAGVAAEHVDGSTPALERAAILSRLASGATPVVCNCNLLTEGFDCPAAEVAILARPTLSTALYLQMVGRVLRPHPGKALARIHDHAGCIVTLGHGLPDSERDYSLGADIAKSRKASESSGGVQLTTCKACFAVFPSGVNAAGVQACPSCGLVVPRPVRKPIREVAGNATPLEQLRGEEKPRPADGASHRYLVHTWKEAIARGYKPGWVSFRHKARFGHWPVGSVLDAAEAQARAELAAANLAPTAGEAA